MKKALTYIWMDLFLNLGPPERQCVLTHAILKQLAQEAEVQIHNASTRCKAYTVKQFYSYMYFIFIICLMSFFRLGTFRPTSM